MSEISRSNRQFEHWLAEGAQRGAPCWLVERRDCSPPQWLVRTGRNPPTWTEDASLAQRFDWPVAAAREARSVHAITGFAVEATEHIFDAAPAPAPLVAEPAPEALRAALLAFRFRDTEASLAPEWVNELTRWLALFSWDSALRERALREALGKELHILALLGDRDYSFPRMRQRINRALAHPPSAGADALAALAALPAEMTRRHGSTVEAQRLANALRAAGLEPT